MRLFRCLLLILSLLCLPACDEDDVAALHLRVESDLSGTIYTSSVVLDSEAGPVEAPSDGVDWTGRARLELCSGEFAKLDGVHLRDLRITAGREEGGVSFARVVLPRGKGARWPSALTSTDEARRKALARNFDPAGRVGDVGGRIKLVIETPTPVVSKGYYPHVRGVRSEAEENVATLLVDLDMILESEGELVWHVTW